MQYERASEALFARSAPKGHKRLGNERLIADASIATLLLAVAFLTRQVWFGDPVADFDEQLYSLIGSRMLQGDLPYVDLWDRKPFGLFALFALAHAIGGPEPISYQILATLFAAFGGWLVYRLALPITDRITACGTGLIYIGFMSAYGSFSGQSEIFFVPLMLLMLLLVKDPLKNGSIRRYSIAMLIGGIALQIKYTVLPQCIFFGLFCLHKILKQDKNLYNAIPKALNLLLWGLSPTLFVIAVYYYLGHFSDFFFANFVSFFERAPAPSGRFDPRILTFLVPLAMLFGGGLYAQWRFKSVADTRSYVLYIVWSAFVFLSVFFPATVYPYYFASVVPAAILVGTPLLHRTGPLGPLPLLLVMLGSFTPHNMLKDRIEAPAETSSVQALAQRIAPHVNAKGPDGCLYVFDGPTALYAMTNSCLPTRFIYPDHLNNDLERASLGVAQAEEVARIFRHKPGVVITADRSVTVQNAESTAVLKAALAGSYRKFSTARMRDREITAWIRTDRAGSSP